MRAVRSRPLSVSMSSFVIYVCIDIVTVLLLLSEEATASSQCEVRVCYSTITRTASVLAFEGYTGMGWVRVRECASQLFWIIL